MIDAKQKKSVLLALCAAFVVACLALAGCGGGSSASSAASDAGVDDDSAGTEYQLIEPGKIIVGSDLDFKPMEYQDNGEAAGFGVAMMNEVANRLGLECEFLPPQNFDSLLTQVASATKMDIAVSSITITDERWDLVDFSDPYYDSNLAIVVKADSAFATKDDLADAAMGAQSGSSGEAWIKENLGTNEYTPYTGPTDAMAALRTDKVQAVVYDAPVAENLCAGEYSDCKVLEIIPTGEQYGIAINKDNTKLTEDINSALAEMQADGTMDKLKSEYIG